MARTRVAVSKTGPSARVNGGNGVVNRGIRPSPRARLSGKRLAVRRAAARTGVLAMVIPDITNPFYPEVVNGAEEVALRSGYLVATINTDDRLGREQEVLAALRSRKVKGLLLSVTQHTQEVSHIQELIDAGIPVVCLDRIPKGIALDAVSVDNVKGAQVCVRHLISMGHREVATITGPTCLESARERLRGYRQAMREANLPVIPNLVLTGGCEVDTGYQLGKKLLLQRRIPSALFVTSGTLGIGVLRALEETGCRCPEDIAVAIFDDYAVPEGFRPHLTAVDQPAHSIGGRAAQLLLDRLQGLRGSSKPARIRLEPQLRIRESTFAYKGRPAGAHA